MPLIKRAIEPIELSRSALAPGVRNELECVTNNTLANVIRQLSSLSLHAENMFSELFRDASSFFERANNLQERIDRLKVKVTQLDSTVEEVSLQDINTRKPFRSSVMKDAQVVNIQSRPYAITQTYLKCDAPPPLSKLNPYREDGKDSMKFYTDPTYFFELWCHEMTKDTEQQKKDLKQRRRNKVSRKVNSSAITSSQLAPSVGGGGAPNTTTTTSTPNAESGVQMRPKGQRDQRQPQKVRDIKSRKDEYQKMAKGKEFIPEGQQQQMAEDGRSPSRPNSLELQNANFLAQQSYSQGQQYPPGYGPPPQQQQQQPQPQPQQQQVQQYEYTNGPVRSAGYGDDGDGQHGNMAPQQYDQQLLQDHYNHNHNINYPNTGGGYGEPQPSEVIGSPQQTPTRRPSTSGSRAPSAVSSPRPTMAPPPPPGSIVAKDGSPMGSRSDSASRESLPPPPPPPPADGAPAAVGNAAPRGTPPFSPNTTPNHQRAMQINHLAQRHDSPGRQQRDVHSPSPQHSTHSSHTKSSTPDSIDLPPPPPPPPLSQTPDTPGSMPPPPPTPPPPELHDGSGGADANQVGPPPPPPPPLPTINNNIKPNGPMPNGGIPSAIALAAANLAPTGDSISINSNASSATASSGETNKSEEKNDERSDLLKAIRTGIQLRKGEERRVKEQQRKHPPTGLDVQSIMEAAFEMRRKALEANDSEEDDDNADSDVVWDSEED